MAKLFLTSSDDVMALRLRGALSQRLSNKFFVAGLCREGEYNDDDCIRVRKDSLMAIEVRLPRKETDFRSARVTRSVRTRSTSYFQCWLFLGFS